MNNCLQADAGNALHTPKYFMRGKIMDTIPFELEEKIQLSYGNYSEPHLRCNLSAC